MTQIQIDKKRRTDALSPSKDPTESPNEMSSNSPCAACKFLRRKCTQGCVFAPYFPPENPGRFASVHRVFGASNVAKLLNDIVPARREDAVTSLAYEAEARLRDPINGCIGIITQLQQRIDHIRFEIHNAKKELANYIGPFNQQPTVVVPHIHHQQYYLPPGMELALMAPANLSHQNQLLINEQLQIQHHQLAAIREQELLQSYEHQRRRQQHEMMRMNGGMERNPGFGHMGVGPSVALPMPDAGLSLVPAQQPFENLFLAQQQQQEYTEGERSGRSGMGPSA